MSEIKGEDSHSSTEHIYEGADGPPSWQIDETGEPAEPSETDAARGPYGGGDGASDEGEPEEPPEPDRLAVATDRDVDLSRLGVDVVWREGREPLYRSDNREPAEVFANGFEARDLSNTDLREYVREDDPSAFVSTSYREDIGDDFGGKYTYEIDAPGGIDVNKTLGDHPLSYEEEVAFPGGVRGEYIKSAAPYDYRTSELGESVPNPHYIPEGERVRDN
ncbi:hypothetical protein QBB33_06860 [Streptomyces scabiei]|uniref:scabin-related ADP-ribosyltransferase n=1 Tax=Streptomyces scabiei TaxID=1930 RepID=UPI001B308FEF|nr:MULTISPECIES: hypothetical protein [Streptomyces]MBP5868785.1 hypothetical protein [Streptomyces sp. LBUM 1485]MBP5915292.1 hypothetical protein [Streptomyces sp. LBUM 1486]MDX3034217.1 hypothetical protein [Streptomyces scabiei]MDX3210348.1 hypothetical protein [Streptomyces scabiei]QTU55348.1 hypothetical protein F3K21_23050 [Streptomyces sp. LBUM 1480]